MFRGPKWLDVSQYVSREPVILALLTGLAFISVLAVAGLAKIYNAQQDALADRWAGRGVADLAAKSYPAAVTDFRTALLYSRDNPGYELNLAEALLGENRTDEASAYLVNLWDREPENARVNLELARIAASKRQIEKALRYYHNAIYSVWPAGQEIERQNTRIELIDLLLRINYKAQAQSELIALAANLEPDSDQHTHVGTLFVQAQAYEPALEQFRMSLRRDRRDQAALAGAGLAAFELQRYPLAERYLTEAVAVNPNDAASVARLKTAQLVLRIDPFRQGISMAQRNRDVVDAFSAAGQRLTNCGVLSMGSTAQNAAQKPAAVGPLQDLAQQWTKLKPQISESGLRRNPDLMNAAMNLVFSVEHETTDTCGLPDDTNMALALIAKLHEGN